MRLVLCAALFLGSAAASFATTLHVPGDYPTIAAGISIADAGDTVLVACGTYYEHDLQIPTALCLRSETGEPDCVTIDAERLGRVIACENVDPGPSIEGFTLTGGVAFGSGYDPDGGGISLFGTPALISNCVLTGNEAENGGSGMSCRNSDAVISRCAFISNLRSVDGGGLFCMYSSPIISDCVFYDNAASFWGGAIFFSMSEPRISGCTLVRNSAHWGGGLWAVGTNIPVLKNTLVAFSIEGQGLYLYDNPSFPSTVDVTCCNVYGNEGANYGGVLPDQTGINGNISEHPLFCNLDAGDLHLATSSPCLPGNNGCAVLMGAFGEGCSSPTSVPGATAMTLAWSRNVPNPFNPATEIQFELRADAPVTLEIFDVAGHRVRSLVDGEAIAAGRRSVPWDGMNDAGQGAGSGVYFYRLEAGRDGAVRKMTLIR